MRSYYLSSALGAYLSNGSRVNRSGTCRDVDQALTEAIGFLNPRAIRPAGGWTYQHEPDWSDPTLVHRAMVRFGFSNAAGFASAMALGTNVFQPLRTYRNFVAHRNRGTAMKVRALARARGVPGALADSDNPIDLGLRPGRGRPQSLVADWIDEMLAIVELVPS